MRFGNEVAPAPEVVDHAGLWRRELRGWTPDMIFDAHVHLGLPEAVGAFSPQRLREPLCTFAAMSWEEMDALHRGLFEGKSVAGVVGFPWPVHEVNMEQANRYIVAVMRREPRLKGCVLTHPTDVSRVEAELERARRAGVRFAGVKPYFDLLGKSNYQTTMPEFIPEGLWTLMESEGLIMTLHTSGRGMGVPENQEYLRGVLERHPTVRIVLAHMGRYLEADEFFRFCDSGLLEEPRLYLETSSATLPEVYRRALLHRGVEDRLVFGTDLPFGLLTGVETWSPETGPTFITRDRYVWSDARANARFAEQCAALTYNTYHVIDALRQAIHAVYPDADRARAVKEKVFHRNAAALFGG